MSQGPAPSVGNGAVGITLTVNGEVQHLEVDTRLTLVFALRESLGLTGTRFGCLTGHCGACTVLLDGRAVKACTVLAASADGCAVVTIEGLARDGRLHPLQQAFWDEFGFQCGYCTPGMIMTTLELLDRDPHPSPDGIKAALSGNLCRCTGYQTIVSAVLAAAAAIKEPAT